VEAYAPTGTIYAERLEMRTVDSARAGQRDTYAIARFLVRFRTDLTTANRLVCDGRTYDVLAVDQPPPRRSCLVLTCEEVTL
jgi:SPP1 family predicted phage head-tail adaptor